MKNICNNCGAAILNGARFCPKCGTAINGTPKQEKSGCLGMFAKGIAVVFCLIVLLALIGSCGRSKSPSQNQSVAYGTTKTFWKAYGAEIENYGAPLAYGKDEQGAIGLHGDHEQRLLVKLSTRTLSDKISAVELHIYNGDVQALILYFVAGAKALVAMGSPNLSAEEVDAVLDELHITKDAQRGPCEYSVKRGDVTYTFKNELEYLNGLTFTAEIK